MLCGSGHLTVRNHIKGRLGQMTLKKIGWDPSSINQIDSDGDQMIAFLMPTICRFYGIIIQMYYADHDPPHFHVIYNEYKAVIGILDFSVLQGDLPPKALGMVVEWARTHRDQLLKDWNLSMQKVPLEQIAPLE